MRFAIAVILILVISPAFPQPTGRAIVNQPIQWTGISSNIKIAPRATLFLDAQLRFAGVPDAFKFESMQHQLRVHLDFTVKGKLTFAPLGYVQVWNYLYGKQPAAAVNNEHRIYQQLSYSHPAGRWTISHRLRSEERFIQDHASGGESLGYINKQFRVRYRVMANYPLNQPKIAPGVYFASLYYEGFKSRGERVTFHDIDQNRFYAGIGRQFDHGLNINAGLFHQMLVKSNGAKQENNLGILVMITKNIDLTKKED